MNAEYDGVSDSYYFSDPEKRSVTKTVELGTRTVNVDMDAFGRIIGIEII